AAPLRRQAEQNGREAGTALENRPVGACIPIRCAEEVGPGAERFVVPAVDEGPEQPGRWITPRRQFSQAAYGAAEDIVPIRNANPLSQILGDEDVDQRQRIPILRVLCRGLSTGRGAWRE